MTLFARWASGRTASGTCGGSGRRVLKPDGTLWVSVTHHILFSLGFALQSLGYRVIKRVEFWVKSDTVAAVYPDIPPEAARPWACSIRSLTFFP